MLKHQRRAQNQPAPRFLLMVRGSRHDLPTQRTLRRKRALYLGVAFLLVVLLLEAIEAFHLH